VRGTLQKRLGEWNHMQVSDGLEGFTLRLFTKGLGWPIEEVRALLGCVREEMKDPNIHAYLNL
jgi:hypothetical protein